MVDAGHPGLSMALPCVQLQSSWCGIGPGRKRHAYDVVDEQATQSGAHNTCFGKSCVQGTNT